jgi:hypothetical protein
MSVTKFGLLGPMIHSWTNLIGQQHRYRPSDSNNDVDIQFSATNAQKYL